MTAASKLGIYKSGLLPNEVDLILVTDTQAIPSVWLLREYISAAFTREEGVLLVSFYRDLRFYEKALKRISWDIRAQQKGDKFAYIDGLSALLEHEHPLKTLEEQILNQLSMHRSLLIFDHPEVSISASKSTTGGAWCTALSSLNPRSTTTVIFSSADAALLSNKEHAIFLMLAAHQAGRVVQLRPLSTGRAKDITGVVRVTNGGAARDEEEDQELVFFAENSLRIFHRGEPM